MSKLKGNLGVHRKGIIFESSRHPADREDFEATGNESLFTSPNCKGKKCQNIVSYQ